MEKREIKFRVWDKKYNKMEVSPEVPSPFANANINNCFKSDNLIFMQYTGLEDKNGNEIYEGDILLGRFILDEVEDYIFLSLTEEEKETQSKMFVVEDIFYPYTNQIPEDLEVVGNIFENPELLSKLTNN